MKGKTKKVIEFLMAVGLMAIGAAVVVGLIVGVITGLVQIGRYVSGHIRPASVMAADVPAEGIGRAAVRRYGAFVCADEAETARVFETYTEWDGPAPGWYRPDEPMSAVWVDGNARQSDAVDYNAPEGIDPGGIDWNICTTVWGWDGHGAEVWELDLLARVFYIEFWGTSLPCSEAGCDAILNLWASGKYGRTLFEALSYYDPVYGYTYEVYPWIWDWNYDADGLAWCKDFCTERFYNGPEWSAVYFQLGGYHDTDWVPPLYEMDGVYFSGARG